MNKTENQAETTIDRQTIELIDDHHCFVCGDQNKSGLQIQWTTRANTTEAEFVSRPEHQGWKGIVHGGILATLLDEALTRLAWETHGGAVTAEITVRYHSAARIGETLFVKGEISDPRGRIIPGRSEIRNAEGVLIASAEGKAIKPKSPAQ